jgi:hypothetical protein
VTVNIGGLSFKPVLEGSIVLGTTKGGWVYSSQRPSFEARLPMFFALEHPLTSSEVGAVLGIKNEGADSAMETLTSFDLRELAENLTKTQAFEAFLENNPGAWELRTPTEAEWRHGHAQKVIHLNAGLTERLADAPASNYRGAMMDGRPRPNELLGPASSQAAAIAVHPRKPSVIAVTSVPLERPLPNVVARLVLSPVRTGTAKRVPNNTDLWANVRSEVLWTTVLGIIPSFLIPVMRGMSAYATEGWANLLFGGLCAGFFTGAIWRPRRSVLTYERAAQFVEDSPSDSQ